MTDLSSIPLCELVAEICRREKLAAPEAAASAIVAQVATATGIDSAIILSRVRSAPVAAARAHCMAATYRLGFSSLQVGRIFGRCHASVLHALKTTRLHPIL